MTSIKPVVENYTYLLQELKSEWNLLPKGALITRGTQYYVYEKGKKDRGITRQPKKIMQLARRKYVEVLIRSLTDYLASPLKDSHSFNFPTHKEIVTSLPNAYQDLPDTYFYQTSLTSWLQQSIPLPRYPEARCYPTKAGYLVRSKEEVFISDALTDHGIPHQYELPYQTSNGVFRPDFTIKNPYTGKTIIWEHHGAFHVEKYGESAHRKILSYTKAGLLLNDTLIVTYSDDLKTPNRLEEIIDAIRLKI